MSKKCLFLLVLSVGLLGGCVNSSTSGNITPTGNEPTNTVEPSTSEDTTPTSTGGDVTSEDTVSVDTTPSTDTAPEEHSYTTPNDVASNFSAGYQFDITAGSQDRLKGYMDPEGKVIQSIETTNISIQEHITKDGDSKLELTISTGKKDGTLTFNTIPLKGVSFTLQSYSKYIAYSSSYSRDEAPEVKINNSYTKTLSVATDGENPIEEFAVTFNEPTSKVSISTTAAHRAFVKSVTFIY